MWKIVYTPTQPNLPAQVNSYHETEADAWAHLITTAIPNEWGRDDPQDDCEVSVAIVIADGGSPMIVVTSVDDSLMSHENQPFYTIVEVR